MEETYWLDVVENGIKRRISSNLSLRDLKMQLGKYSDSTKFDRIFYGIN